MSKCKNQITQYAFKRVLFVGFARKYNKNLDSFVVSDAFIKEDRHSTDEPLEKKLNVEILTPWNYTKEYVSFSLEH